MQPIQLFDPASSTYTYLLYDEVTREALIVDPVDDQIERDLSVLRQYGLKLMWAVATPGHAGHIPGAARLALQTGAKTAAPQGSGNPTAALQLADGDTLAFGTETLQAQSMPGHADASLAYVWRDHLFAGGAIVWPGHDHKDRTHSGIGLESAHLRHDADRMGEQSPQPATGYAGDVTPALAHAWWQSGEAVLVDIRTDAEREWVGFVPGAIAVAWKQWPGMAMNTGFDAALKEAVPARKKVLLLCRSGVRSVAAAKRATELGLEAYNILEGFEGDPDGSAHRGKLGGWRLAGLPWRQG